MPAERAYGSPVCPATSYSARRQGLESGMITPAKRPVRGGCDLKSIEARQRLGRQDSPPAASNVLASPATPALLWAPPPPPRDGAPEGGVAGEPLRRGRRFRLAVKPTGRASTFR